MSRPRSRPVLTVASPPESSSPDTTKETADNGTAPSSVDDPFSDLNKIRISEDFGEGLGREDVAPGAGKKARETRIHSHTPVPHFQIDTAVVELRENREFFMPVAGAREALLEDLVPVRLITSITRAGVVFLWPPGCPDPTAAVTPGMKSALEIAELARSHWVRMSSSRSLGAYQCFRATADLPEPVWPEGKTFQDLLRIGFSCGYLIQDENHPVIKRLLGRA